MRVNFTVEMPQKGGTTNYYYDIDPTDPIFNYTVNGKNGFPSIKDVQIEPKDKQNDEEGNVKVISSEHINITETEKIVKTIKKRVIKRREKKLALAPNAFHDSPETKESIKLYERDYLEGCDDADQLVKEHEKLLNNIKNKAGFVKEGDLSMDSTDKDIHEENERLIEKLRKKLKNYDDEHDEYIKSYKDRIRVLQRDLEDANDTIKILKQTNDSVESSKGGLDDQLENLRHQIKEKHTQFDELNRYINDLLMEKKKWVVQFEQQRKVIDNLNAQVTGPRGVDQDEVIRIEERYKIKINKNDKEIEDLKDEVYTLEGKLRDKDKEITTLKLQTREVFTNTTNTKETKETKVLKLKPKENLKEWKRIFFKSKNLAKNYRELVENATLERIHDDLDLEPEEENAESYYDNTEIFLEKLDKYYKDLDKLLKENKELRNNNEKMKNDLNKGKDNVANLDSLKNIFDKSKTSTDYFVDLLKSAKKDKYVNFKHLQIDSNNPDLYLEGIDEYFSFHQTYYTDIKDLIEEKNKELKKLKEFEKEVLQGKNKDNCLDDFRNILEKNQKVNVQVVTLLNNIEGKDSYKYEKPNVNANTNANEHLDLINEEFDTSNKNLRNLNNIVNDLVEENDRLKEKDRQSQNKPKGVSIDELRKMLTQSQNVNAEVKEVSAAAKNEMDSSELDIKVDSKSPELYIEGIERLNAQSLSDLKGLKSTVKDMQYELDRLKDMEREMNKGKNKTGALNDYRYILGKTEGVKENLRRVSELTDLPPMKVVDEMEGITEESPDQYLDAVNRSIKSSNKIIYELEGVLKNSNQEVERLRIFEKEVKEGKNKEAALKDFKKIYQSSKDNLKGVVRNVEKARGDMVDDNVSMIIDDDPKDLLNAIETNNDKIHAYNRELNNLINDLQDEVERLKRFEKEAKEGKSKERVVEDFKQIMNDNKDLQNDIESALKKATGQGRSKEFDISVSGKDPDIYLEAINKYNERSRQDIGNLIQALNEKNVELKKLQQFEKDVLDGNNKVGALKDLKELCKENMELAKKNKENAEKAGDTNFYDNLDFDFDSDNPNHYIAYIKETQAANRRYNDSIDKDIDKLKGKNKKLNLDIKNYEGDLEEVTTIKKKQETTIIELQGRLRDTEASSVKAKDLMAILKNNNTNIEDANKIIEERTNMKNHDLVVYDESQTDNQVLLQKISNQTEIIRTKIQMLAATSETKTETADPAELVEILKQTEAFKEEFLEMYEDVTLDTIDDTTEIDLTQATSVEMCVKYIAENVEFLQESMEIFKDEISLVVQNLTKKKNELLNENMKIKTLLNDTQEDLSQKTMLLGKLQVKLLIVLSYVGSLEDK